MIISNFDQDPLLNDCRWREGKPTIQVPGTLLIDRLRGLTSASATGKEAADIVARHIVAKVVVDIHGGKVPSSSITADR